MYLTDNRKNCLGKQDAGTWQAACVPQKFLFYFADLLAALLSTRHYELHTLPGSTQSNGVASSPKQAFSRSDPYPPS